MAFTFRWPQKSVNATGATATWTTTNASFVQSGQKANRIPTLNPMLIIRVAHGTTRKPPTSPAGPRSGSKSLTRSRRPRPLVRHLKRRTVVVSLTRRHILAGSTRSVEAPTRRTRQTRSRSLGWDRRFSIHPISVPSNVPTMSCPLLARVWAIPAGRW